MNRFAVWTFSVVLLPLAAQALAAGTTYSADVAPLVEQRCVSCHGAKSPEYPSFKKEKDAFVAKGIGPRMDTYAHLIYYTAWPDTGALMRRLDDGAGGGKPGNMYVYLGDTEEERKANLEKMKSWVGGWTLKRWNEITKEELSAIVVPY